MDIDHDPENETTTVTTEQPAPAPAPAPPSGGARTPEQIRAEIAAVRAGGGERVTEQLESLYRELHGEPTAAAPPAPVAIQTAGGPVDLDTFIGSLPDTPDGWNREGIGLLCARAAELD